MIISASRRTDIPAFFSEWFMNRIKERYVLVRNPMNHHQISRIDLSPEIVDGIVFMTKNPVPMLNKLHLLQEYMYYFQFTLTSYGSDIEPNVPSKNDVIIPTFQRLADMIGPDRVIWRYDPILLNEKYSLTYHIEQFDRLAEKLGDYTNRCTISFIDFYRSTRNKTKDLKLTQLSDVDIDFLAMHLSQSARRHNLEIETCAEKVDLEKYNIAHGRCVDEKLFEKLLGFSLKMEKTKPTRPGCGCAASLDIGAYNTCSHGCKYCYANLDQNAVISRSKAYKPQSPILCDVMKNDDVIGKRILRSNRSGQLRLFD